MAVNVTHNGGAETDSFAIQYGKRIVIRNSDGIPYVIVENLTENSICVYKGNGTTPTSFSEQDADNNPANVTTPYGSPSAAIDTNDLIHIIYAKDDGKSSQLLYCQFRADGVNDDFQNVDTVVVSDLDADIVDVHNCQTSVAIDSNNKPHVAFRNDAKSDDWTIQYINNVDGSWNSGVYYEVEGETNGVLCSAPEIAIDADDKPVITYINDTDHDVGTAIGNANDATTFTLYDIYTIGSAHKSSIAVDSSGNHHVAYSDGASGYLEVRTHNYGDGWTTWQTADRLISSGYGNNIPMAIVCNGTDRYVFYEASDNDIDYYYNTGSGWTYGGTLDEGTYNTVRAKWAFWVDNDSGGVLVTSIKQETYNANIFIYGGSGTFEAAAQSFKPTSDCVLIGVQLLLDKTGSPTDNIYVRITSTLGGAALTTSNDIPSSSVSTDGSWHFFEFAPISLTANTTYYIELERDGARDLPNRVDLCRMTGSGYADGDTFIRDSGVWGSGLGNDSCFRIYLKDTSASELDYVFMDETASPDVQYNSLPLLLPLTYYFDASDAGPSDPDEVWFDDANAFDGSIETSPAQTNTSGSSTSNYLGGTGTTAPNSGPIFNTVKVRIYYATVILGAFAVGTSDWSEVLGTYIFTEYGSGWSEYLTLSEPSGGWSWQTLNNLQIRFWATQDSIFNYYNVRKAELLISLEQTISAKGNISTGIQQYTQTINAKGAVKKETSRTITAKGAVQQTFQQTIASKGRIQISSQQTITTKGEIQATATQTLTAKALINTYYFDGSNGIIDLSGNWVDDANAFDGSTNTFAYDPTSNWGYLLGKGTNAPSSGPTIMQIRVRLYCGADGADDDWSEYVALDMPSGGWTWSKVQSLWVYIRGNFSTVQAFVWTDGPEEELGYAQRTVSNPPNYDAYRVEIEVILGITTTKTISAKGNITPGFQEKSQIISTKGRIQIVTAQTIQSKARIGKQFAQSIIAKSRIQISSSQIIQAKAAIVTTTTHSIQAKADIKTLQQHTINAKASLKLLAVVRTVQTRGRIQITSQQAIQSTGRIQRTRTRTLEAKSRIQLTITRAITAKANIKLTATQIIEAKSRIAFISTQTVQAKGRIQKSFLQTINAKGRIAITSIQIVSTKGRIQKSFNQTIQTKARIKTSSIKTIEAKGRIQKSKTQTITVKADVQRTFIQTIEAKGNISLAKPQTISAKGSIKKQFTQTLTAKARIQISTTRTIEAKGNIFTFITTTRTIESKGRIEITFIQSITAKARIQKISTQTIGVKANIKITAARTIQAKASIKKLSTKIISAKGKITATSIQSIEAKASIKKTFSKEVSGKGQISIAGIARTVSAKAEIHMFVELFDSNVYKDAGETTAEWDTATEKVRLPGAPC